MSSKRNTRLEERNQILNQNHAKMKKQLLVLITSIIYLSANAQAPDRSMSLMYNTGVSLYNASGVSYGMEANAFYKNFGVTAGYLLDRPNAYVEGNARFYEGNFYTTGYLGAFRSKQTSISAGIGFGYSLTNGITFEITKRFIYPTDWKEPKGLLSFKVGYTLNQ